MCGRFTLATDDLEALGVRFNFGPGGLRREPRFNIAPTNDVLVVVDDGERRAGYMRWGLIPSWSPDKPSRPLINARAETVAEKPSFRRSLRRRRCLVIADGYYEWRRTGGQRTPYWYGRADGEPFAFAGLWDTWRAPQNTGADVSGEGVVASCAIVTTGANELAARVHDRMPVILARDMESMWLDPDITEPEPLLSLLASYPAGEMTARRVSQAVNSVRNDGPELVEPITS